MLTKRQHEPVDTESYIKFSLNDPLNVISRRINSMTTKHNTEQFAAIIYNDFS